MNALHYLLQVNVYLVLFYGFYWLVLRGETFHQLNRWYLVAAAALSFFIPVWESDWVQRWFVTERVHQTIYTYYNPQTVFVTTLRPEEPAFRLTWGDAFAFVYIAGVLGALGKFGYQIAHLERLLRRRKRANNRQAFSFFGHLFVGKALDKRDTILAHERVHVRQLHSADVLLFELILIFNWFNPVVYLYRRSVRHLHEFIADEVASRCEATKADYAMLLFSQQFGVETNQLVNPFFSTSLLKRRILMLQKPRSRRTALLKYGLTAPLFGLMLVMSSASVAENPVLQTIENRVGSSQAIVDKPVQDDENTITGRVTDEAGKPLAKVIIEQQPNSNLGIRDVTNEDGKFVFLRSEQASSARFSLPGYETSQVPLGTQKQFEIRLIKKTSVSQEEATNFIALAAHRAAEARQSSLMGQTEVDNSLVVGFSIDQGGWIQNITLLNEAKGDRYGLFAAFRDELKAMPRWETGRGEAYLSSWRFFSNDAQRGYQSWREEVAQYAAGRKKLGTGIIGLDLDPMPKSSGPNPYGVTAARITSVTPAYEHARFQGGEKALQAFLANNLKYPQEAAGLRETKIVFAHFVIDETGTLSQFTLPEKYGYGFDEEALRIFKLLPRFEPYKKQGQPVVSRYTLRLRFDPDEVVLTMPTPPAVPIDTAAVERVEDDPVFTRVDQHVEFPGGFEAMRRYLSKKLRYPAAARRAKVEGKVYLTFVVEKDGSFSDVRVLKGKGFGLDEEAVRVLNAMPNWNPAKADGKIVRSRFNLPVEFRLDGKVPPPVKAPLAPSKSGIIQLVVPDTRRGTVIPKDRLPLVILDDKIVDEKILRGIDRLDVKDFKFLTIPEAVQKYGEKAQHGAVIVTGL